MFDPISLGVMGVSTGLGFLNSKRQADEAKRVEKMNRELGANDTLFSPFVKQQAQKMAQPDAGAGALGGAFQGALSGFNQAQLLKPKASIYDDLLKGVDPLAVKENAKLTSLAQRAPGGFLGRPA